MFSGIGLVVVRRLTVRGHTVVVFKTRWSTLPLGRNGLIYDSVVPVFRTARVLALSVMNTGLRTINKKAQLTHGLRAAI